MKEKLLSIWVAIVNWFFDYGYKIIVALAILIISFAIVDLIVRIIKKICIKKQFDKTLGKTMRYVLKYALKVIIVICLMGYLGIETTGVAALVAAAGLSIGLALQGSLSNIAGGLLLIITRPFKIDDYIECNGVGGFVEDIHIIYTVLRTFDNKMIQFPNGQLANNVIVNHFAKDIRRVDLVFGISYGDDFKKAEKIITDIAEKHPLVLKQPSPVCRILEHGNSSINLKSMTWCRSVDYWTVYFDMLESVKAEFDSQGVTIPFNQLDVHFDKDQLKELSGKE